VLDGLLADTDLLKQLLAASPERIEFLVSERHVGHVRGHSRNLKSEKSVLCTEEAAPDRVLRLLSRASYNRQPIPANAPVPQAP
jgi:hypothetical protein